MNILLTGATGYIARRLLTVLVAEGHQITCCVRDAARFDISSFDTEKISVVQADFLDAHSLHAIPENIDVAYYLIHSMSSSINSFEESEKKSAFNFIERLKSTRVQQVIYLSGIINSKQLSKHLMSRFAVEKILSSGTFNLTVLRAGIIVGSGSASFEIIRDLVEKLPIMVAPRWLMTKTQPIAIRNVIQFLTGALLNRHMFNNSFDIGGPEILTYKQMLLKFAEIRRLKRKIWVVPVMTPKLSSYWLYFITSTSYKLAVNLVNSMKVEIICRENNLDKMLGIDLIDYENAVRMAFDKMEQQDVVSSWTDALSAKPLEKGISNLESVPEYGCYQDIRKRKVQDSKKALDNIWSVGGATGWYYANWLWALRGFIDKFIGGVGLNRGRKNSNSIAPGDSIDFWRVLYASREDKRLLLYAEMKLPGEAWLEFKIEGDLYYQTATFRPLGLWGRLYWFAVMPLHNQIFKGMADRISGTKAK